MDPTVETMAGGLTCSGRGCRADARFSVLWNNPRLHTPERRKVWLACEEHRGSLAEFLAARGFLRGVEPLAADDGEAAPVTDPVTDPVSDPVSER